MRDSSIYSSRRRTLLEVDEKENNDDDDVSRDRVCAVARSDDLFPRRGTVVEITASS